MQFVPNEKAVPIRVSSTANLMVDSADRNQAVNLYCNDFQVTKMNNILNGFFTRIGTTEVVFEWNTPNVTDKNNKISYKVNEGEVEEIFFGPGFYNVAEALDTLVVDLNKTSATTGLTWTVTGLIGAGAKLTVTGAPGIAYIVDGDIIRAINAGNRITGTIPLAGSNPYDLTAGGADLRPARYVDIVCNQLTYNQAVKDASTALLVRDVLCRWYFDFDNQNPVDNYGFPILMGYTPFYLRRLFNPPKQIQWQANIPIGNLSFQLYSNDGIIIPVNRTTQYLMTLQVSEN